MKTAVFHAVKIRGLYFTRTNGPAGGPAGLLINDRFGHSEEAEPEADRPDHLISPWWNRGAPRIRIADLLFAELAHQPL